MRMTRVRNDEQGAVLAVVALTLIALMGMAVLVIDVGGLLVMKRRMVTTSDAAALAAAQQCAQSNGEVVARAEADEVATANFGSADGRVVFTPGCTGSTGEAAARYHADQTLFFAPILGLGENMGVSAPATAIWGPASSGNSVPLMIGAPQFGGNGPGQCDFPPPGPPSGQTCAFWYDSDQIGNASWGWMNLDEWDVPGDDNCTNTGSAQRSEWIANNYPVALPLSWPDPTYVCVDTGFTDANWEDIRDIVPSTRIFPVNDQDGSASLAQGGPAGHGQVDKNGNLAPPPDTPDKYDIIGFTVLKITALYDGNTVEAIGTQGDPGVPAIVNLPCSDKANFDENNPPDIFAIYELDASGCPDGTLPDSVTRGVPFIYTESGGGPNKVQTPKTECATSTSTGCDYYYDPVTFEIHWIGPDEKNVFIDFTWSRAGTPATDGTRGACSPPDPTYWGFAPPPDTDAKLQDKCLVTEWVGYQSTGLDVGTGPDFGLRAIRLFE